MSAERLRQAATLLRERAEAATPGPWSAIEGASGGWWVERRSRATVTDDVNGYDAAFIATMDPTVALAVADWLDLAARQHDRRTEMVAEKIAEHADDPDKRERWERIAERRNPATDAALTVADAVLAEASR